MANGITKFVKEFDKDEWDEMMFYRCGEFNQDISNWDVSKVKYNFNVFNDCPIKEKYKPKFK